VQADENEIISVQIIGTFAFASGEAKRQPANAWAIAKVAGALGFLWEYCRGMPVS
jgi:hypothetical protein